MKYDTACGGGEGSGSAATVGSAFSSIDHALLSLSVRVSLPAHPSGKVTRPSPCAEVTSLRSRREARLKTLTDIHER